MIDLKNLTIEKAHESLSRGDFSVRELVDVYLGNINSKNKELNAYLGLYKNIDEEVRLAEEKFKNGTATLLTGIPFAVKDNILIEGETATAGSKILENYIASYDATAVKLLKKEGVIFLGRTNMDEFAMGSSTQTSAYGVARNPLDLTRVPGGSSGGSAGAVASLMTLSALGTETCGSVREPSAFCGLVGLKPTYGAVSRSGLISMASSLDKIGPITKTVEDCRIVFDAIKGKDPLDATSIESQISNFKSEIKNIKIGVPKEYFGRGINSNVKKIIEDAIKKAKKHGAKIVPISLPNSKYAVACYYIIVPSEVSANLARFDGIKYGLYEDAENLLDGYMKTRGRGFGIEVKRRIMLGTYSLSSGYYDAYYKKAQEVRQIIKEDFIDAFKKVDLIFSPVSPIPAFKIGEKTDDALSMYLMDIYTCPVKLAGLPAISLPVGNIGKLPVGLQIIGKYFEENKIFNIASQLEKML